MNDDRGRIDDMIAAIEAIERHRPPDEAAFAGDELLQVWIIHHLQVIGEAASRLSDSFRQQHPVVPWRKLIGMRNVIVHGYDALRLDVVWGVVARDLPILAAQLKSIVEDAL